MSVWEAMFFGIVQGLTEFLPVSSSGHLAFFHALSGASAGQSANGELAFDLLLHLGTLAAVCIVYHKDVWALFRAFFSLAAKLGRARFRLRAVALTAEENLLVMLFAALVPLVAGALLEDLVSAARAYLWVIGVLWMINGGVLWVSDRLSEKRSAKSRKDVRTPKNALKVGLCQLLAVLPGVSRSGMTVAGGMLCGFDRAYAVKFSFLLSIPAILGANVLSLRDLAAHPIVPSDLLPYLFGMAAALLSGLFAIRLLTYLSRRKNLRVFSIYCIAAGVLAVVLYRFV